MKKKFCIVLLTIIVACVFMPVCVFAADSNKDETVEDEMARFYKFEMDKNYDQIIDYCSNSTMGGSLILYASPKGSAVIMQKTKGTLNQADLSDLNKQFPNVKYLFINNIDLPNMITKDTPKLSNYKFPYLTDVFIGNVSDYKILETFLDGYSQSIHLPKNTDEKVISQMFFLLKNEPHEVLLDFQENALTLGSNIGTTGIVVLSVAGGIIIIIAVVMLLVAKYGKGD